MVDFEESLLSLLENASRVSYNDDFVFYPENLHHPVGSVFNYARAGDSWDRPEVPSLALPSRIHGGRMAAFLIKSKWFDVSAARLSDICHPNKYCDPSNIQGAAGTTNDASNVSGHTDYWAKLTQLVYVLFHVMLRYDDCNDNFEAVWLSERVRQALDSLSMHAGQAPGAESHSSAAESDDTWLQDTIAERTRGGRGQQRGRGRRGRGGEQDLMGDGEDGHTEAGVDEPGRDSDVDPAPKINIAARKDCHVLMGYVFNDECKRCMDEHARYKRHYQKAGRPFVFYKMRLCDHDKLSNDYSPVKYYILYFIAKGWDYRTWLLRWQIALHYVLYHRKYTTLFFNGQEEDDKFQVKDGSDMWKRISRPLCTALMKHYIRELLPQMDSVHDPQAFSHYPCVLNPATVFTLERIEAFLGAQESCRKLLIPHTTLMMEPRALENWYQVWKRYLLHRDAFVQSGFPALFPGLFNILDDVDEVSMKIQSARACLRGKTMDHQCRYRHHFLPTMPTENFNYRHNKGHVAVLRRQIKERLQFWVNQNMVPTSERGLHLRSAMTMLRDYLYGCYMLLARTDEANASDAVREVMAGYRHANYSWYQAAFCRPKPSGRVVRDPFSVPVFPATAPFYSNLTPYKNYLILQMKEFAWYHNFDSHKTQMMLRYMRAMQDCVREVYDMHIHVATVSDKEIGGAGGPGVGKSHMVNGLTKVFLPGLLKTKGYESAASRNVNMYGRMNDRIYTMDEASQRNVVSLHEGGLADPQLKMIMSQGYCESSCLEFLDTEDKALMHGDSRRTRDRFYEMLGTFWFLTNQDYKGIKDQAFLDRLLIDSLTRTVRYVERARLTDRRQSTRFPDYVRVRSYAMQLSHLEIHKMIAFGVLPMPGNTVLLILKDFIKKVLEKHGMNTNTYDRLFSRIQSIATVDCIQRVVFTNFFHPSGFFYGEDITPGKLRSLGTFLYINVEDCAMAVFELVDQFAPVIMRYGPATLASMWDTSSSSFSIQWWREETAAPVEVCEDYNDVPAYQRDSFSSVDYNYILFRTEKRGVLEHLAASLQGMLNKTLEQKGHRCVHLQEKRDIVTWLRSMLNRAIPDAKKMVRVENSVKCISASVRPSEEDYPGVFYMENIPKKGIKVSTFWLHNALESDDCSLMRDLRQVFRDVMYLNYHFQAKEYDALCAINERGPDYPRSWCRDILTGKPVENAIERYETIAVNYDPLTPPDAAHIARLQEKYSFSYLHYDSFLSEQQYEQYSGGDLGPEHEEDKDVFKTSFYMGIDQIGFFNHLTTTSEQEKISMADREPITHLGYDAYRMSIARMVLDSVRTRGLVQRYLRNQSQTPSMQAAHDLKEKLGKMIPKTTLFLWHLRLREPANVIRDDLVDAYIHSFNSRGESVLEAVNARDAPSAKYDIESGIGIAVSAIADRTIAASSRYPRLTLENKPHPILSNWLNVFCTLEHPICIEDLAQEWLRVMERNPTMHAVCKKYAYHNAQYVYTSSADVDLHRASGQEPSTLSDRTGRRAHSDSARKRRRCNNGSRISASADGLPLTDSDSLAPESDGDSRREHLGNLATPENDFDGEYEMTMDEPDSRNREEGILSVENERMMIG